MIAKKTKLRIIKIDRVYLCQCISSLIYSFFDQINKYDLKMFMASTVPGTAYMLMKKM